MNNITFEAYEHDMKETADYASGSIKKLKDDIKKRDELIMALIVGAGGRINVPDMAFCDLHKKVMTVYADPENYCRVFTVK